MLSVSIKQTTLAAVVIGTLNLTFGTAAQAASIDLGAGTINGNGRVNANGSVTLTNQSASAPAADDAEGSLNISGFDPLTVFLGETSIQRVLLLPDAVTTTGTQRTQARNTIEAALGTSIFEGSFIRRSLVAAVGDIFSFDWAFDGSVIPTDPNDVGFVKIGDQLFKLNAPTPFQYTFNTAGNFDLAIGVLDAGTTRFSDSSVLVIGNGQLTTGTAVPSPALLPGLVALTAGVLRRQQ